MAATNDGKRHHATSVVGATVVFRDNRRVLRPTDIVGAVEVVEGRDGQHRALADGVQPGKIYERIALILNLANATGLLVGIIRYLIVVATQRSDQAKLIRGGLIKHQRGETSEACRLVMQNTGRRRF